MNLHEYQAKSLLSRYKLPVLRNWLATTPEEAAQAFASMGAKQAVLKAQIHAGGRFKAGGVKIVSSEKEAALLAKKLLGCYLVTPQTDKKGKPVHAVLLCEDIYPVERELYLGVLVDRKSFSVMFVTSTEGGVDIEKIASTSPNKIHTTVINPLIGFRSYQGREIAHALDLPLTHHEPLTTLLANAYQAFVENDLSLLEINPLSVRTNGEFVCVDTKIVVDDNALYRLPHLVKERDPRQENERELIASQAKLHYVALEGNIGCMVNGAGLAMAAMDMIQAHGAMPANFLDIGGSATQERVVTAMNIILADPSVHGILINIFGGIVQCDMVAQGMIKAMQNTHNKIPVVVRLEGNNATVAFQWLDHSGLPFIRANDLADAAQKIVSIVAEHKHWLRWLKVNGYEYIG